MPLLGAGSFKLKFYCYRLSFKYLCYFFLITSLAVTCYLTLNYPQKHWLLIATLSLGLISTSDTFAQRLRLICLATVVLAINVTIADLLSPYYLCLAIYFLVITSLSLSLTRYYNKSDVLIVLILNLFAFISAFNLMSFTDNLEKMFYIFAGGLIALIAQFIFFPNYFRDKLQAYYFILLSELTALNIAIFNCLIRSDYSHQEYQFEKKIHIHKTRCLQILDKMRRMEKSIPSLSVTERNQLQMMIEQLNQLFQSLLDKSQLRWRIKDHSVFDVAAKELLLIAQNINHLLLDLRYHQTEPHLKLQLRKLDHAVERFEEVYQNVLLVTAQEPLAFTLFLTTLKTLNERINTLNQLIKT